MGSDWIWRVWFRGARVDLQGAFGRVANELLYRHYEPRLEVVEHGRQWSFDGDGHLFRPVSAAHRIDLAHLFDPMFAVHTSLVEPLPYQITAVYEAMLPRQPLRFLLADDPGAGKTIMAGLLIKELIARGDLQRCIVVSPGSLAERWQDELDRRFQLPFEILTNDKLEAPRTGNWFLKTIWLSPVSTNSRASSLKCDNCETLSHLAALRVDEKTRCSLAIRRHVHR